MKPSLKVVPTTDPQRAALVAAIEAARPARTELEEARALAEGGRLALAQAEDAVPAVERQIVEARAALVENPTGDRSILRKLRQTEIDARDDREIAREVAARLELQLRDAERSAGYASGAIEAAADAVLALRFADILAAAELAGRRFAELSFVAEFIGQCGDANDGERHRLTTEARSLNAHLVFRGNMEAVEAAYREAEAPWRAARARLMADPTAALPEVG